jgi:hypothetical protein
VLQSLWPWLAVAAAGALHGANPAAGWALVAWSGRGTGRLHALVPVAAGQLASVAMIAAAVPLTLRLGVDFDARVPQGLAAAVLVAVAVRHLRHRGAAPHAVIGLWSFIVATAHGVGWMLVPALTPLCAMGVPGAQITASGSVLLALAAVGVHVGAMLATTAMLAAVVRALRPHST